MQKILLLLLLSISPFAFGQQIIDSCLSSSTPSTGFPPSTNLVSFDADLCQWNGSAWIGGWSGANLTLPPPAGGSGCRAIWCGNGSSWTSGGEGFAIRLNAPLVAGQSYTFNFTTVSHGFGSNGNFSPAVYTNSVASYPGTLIGNLTPAGTSWVTNPFTFTATAAQAGHTWLIIHSGGSGTSGFVNNLCVGCNVPNTSTCSVNLGPDQNLCPGQTTILNATTAGATYLWQNGSTSPTFSVSQSGTYSVTINVNGCTATDAVTVNYGTAPTVNLGPDLTLCTGQSQVLNALSAGSTYLWQNGSTSPTFTVSQAGTYSVTVSNSCGSANDAVVVTYNNLPTVNLGPDLNLCTGQTQVLNASSTGSTYLWQNGSTSPTFTVTQAGTYSVTVSNNCGSTSDVITATYSSPPVVNLGPDLTFCLGESATLDATSSGVNYSWQNGSTSPTIDVTETGIYSVTVSNNCGSATDNIQVTVNPTPNVDLGPDVVLCSGQTLLLDATFSGAFYLWQDGSTLPTFNVDQDGSYSVQTNIGSCFSTDQISVTFITGASIDLGNDTTICFGESLTLDASALGASYIWGDNSTASSLTVTQTGTYSVQVITACGVLNDQITITVLPPLFPGLGNDTSFCAGGTVTLDATLPGVTYLWQDNSTNATYIASQTGTYSVFVSDVYGCTGTDQLVVTVNPLPAVSAGVDQSLCEGSPVILSGTGAANYTWSNGVINGTSFFPPAGATVYTVTGTSSEGCTGTDDVTITTGVSPQIAFTADITSGCTPLTVIFTNTTPGTTSCVWNLSNGTTISGCGTVQVVFEEGGCFDVTLTTEFSSGCFGSYTQDNMICAEEAPNASFLPIPQQLSTLNTEVSFLNSTTGAESYVWYFGDGSDPSLEEEPTHQFPLNEAGSYWITLIAESPLGCIDTAVNYVEVLEELIYYVPNTFTPDGDIVNQNFKPIFTSGFDPFNYNLKIFNRWGELIFESNDANYGWDGSYTNGDAIHTCQQGSYIWKIEFKSRDNDDKQILTGHVNLLR